MKTGAATARGTARNRGFFILWGGLLCSNKTASAYQKMEHEQIQGNLTADGRHMGRHDRRHRRRRLVQILGVAPLA